MLTCDRCKGEFQQAFDPAEGETEAEEERRTMKAAQSNKQGPFCPPCRTLMSPQHQGQLLNTNGMAGARTMRKLKRERLVKELGFKSGQLPRQAKPDFADTEFRLPDESRFHTIYAEPCIQCQRSGQHRLNVITHGRKKPGYSVCCANTNCMFCTPVFDSSQDAIQHWNLTAVLLK